MLVVLVAVISLSFSVIWPSAATAATVPTVVSLGQLQEGLLAPGSMAIDTLGNVYVADAYAHVIQKFDSAGTLQKTFASISVSGGAVAVNADGTSIYTTEAGGRVAILDGQTGAFVKYLGTLTSGGDIAVDVQGSVYVVDVLNRQILKYNAAIDNADGTAGEILNTISGGDSVGGQFRRIVAITINPVTLELYVAGDAEAGGTTSGQSTVKVFSADGIFDGILTDVAAFNGAMSFCKGIVFGPDGLEFYLDQSSVSVRVRDRATGYLSTLAMQGSGAGQMVMPVDMVYDATSNRLLVAASAAKIEIYGINGGTTPLPNQPPSLPTLSSPTAAGNTASVTPQLRFLNATDANNDSVTYDIEIDGVVLADNAQNGETESYVTTAALVENSQHAWKALARDEHGAESGYTAAQTFFVNAVNEAPTAPVLSPTAERLKGSDILSWSVATDPDPNDSLSYRVEVAEDITFTELTLAAELDLNDIQLTAFNDYAMLQDGINYVWRVSAVDKAGLATSSEVGSFVYDTAMLTVSANMPGAEVSLGGNTAYAGASVGVAPVQFRDLPAGAYTVVVERAGCEQFIAQVEITGESNADVAAVLNLAVAPSLRNDAALRVGKSKLQVGMNAAPFAVDFNNDGLIDLLVGDESGTLTLFVASSQRGSKVQYDEVQELNVAAISGAVPFVVDWNNDNRKDLLVGGKDGRVFLFLQESTSSDLSPVFTFAGTPLKIDALDDLNVGSASSPAVADIDNDGDKDLVVGTASGKILSFENVGTDAEPLLAVATEIGSFSGPVAPLFIDWDADGQRDLLMSISGSLNLLVQGEDGMFTFSKTLLSSRATLADQNVKYFVVDLDSAQGKDVFAGFSDGKVTLFNSAGRDYLPSVTQALLDKLAQVEELAVVSGLQLELEAVTAAINSADLRTAGKLAQIALIEKVSTDGEFKTAVDELLALLDR